MRPIPAIDRHLLVSVSGGLTSPLRARPAQTEPVPLVPPRPAPAASLGALPASPLGSPSAQAGNTDPLAGLLSQLASQPR